MTKINICLSCDDNYAKYAGVALTSILYNAKEQDDLAIYILDGGISDSIPIDKCKELGYDKIIVVTTRPIVECSVITFSVPISAAILNGISSSNQGVLTILGVSSSIYPIAEGTM